MEALTTMRRSALHLATLKNNFYLVDYLISCGANVNSQDLDLNTPLHLSSKLGYEIITDYLLKKNANFRLTNSFYEKPSDIACNINIYKVSKNKILILFFYIKNLQMQIILF